jgi:hypothetical protein
MNQLLHFAAFVEIKESGCGFNVYTSSEKTGNRVFGIRVKVCHWEMKFTKSAEDIFMFPETVAAPGAYPGEDEGNEIADVFHGICFCLIGKEGKR